MTTQAERDRQVLSATRRAERLIRENTKQIDLLVQEMQAALGDMQGAFQTKKPLTVTELLFELRTGRQLTNDLKACCRELKLLFTNKAYVEYMIRKEKDTRK